jgi:hypothetical protein
LGGLRNKYLAGIRMDKDLPKRDKNKSDSTPARVLIEEVIRSVQTVDRKIEEFFAIHGTDLEISRDTRPNFRREK